MKNILVVGGSSGIGLGYVKRVTEGNNVINIDIKASEVEGVKDVLFDLSDIDNHYNIGLVDELSPLFEGKIDEVVYCAGIAERPQTTIKNDVELLMNLMNINLASFINLIGVLQDYDILSTEACIVGVSSSHSVRAAAYNPIYSATKGGMNCFVKSASRNFKLTEKFKNVRINAVAPEAVDTPMIRSLFSDEESFKKHNDSRILGRLLTVEEVVEPMLFLQSKGASGITGEVVSIGGLM